MTTGTQLQIIPANIQLPAHLQTAEAVAAIAKYNAEAAGGIKIGGFPRISIKGGKFHIVDGGETTTIMAPAQEGQPPLPLMLLEAVIVSANPALSKTYYEGEYQPGDDKEPTCSADNGIVPDAHIVNKQSPTCALCPKNAWGSKVSKYSGKDVKACQDNKRLALLPVRDLGYKALGFNVTPSALTDWGKYVKALSERNIPVNAVVTNITFDATVSHPKTLFSFSRMLTAEEYAKVNERAAGDDVKNITTPVRQLALPAPAPAAPVPAAPPPAPAGGFGGAQAAPTEAPKRTRAPRKPAEQPPATQDPLAHLPAEVRGTVALLGADSELGKALIAKYPAAVQGTPATAAPVLTPTGPTAAAPTGGFGATTPPITVLVSPTITAAASDLKAKLQARLSAGQASQAGN